MLFEMLVGWAIHIPINTKKKSCQKFASVFGLHILKWSLTSVEISLGLSPFVDEKISLPNITKNDEH